MNQIKTCTYCEIEKPLNEFAIDKRNKSGFESRCKSCKSQYRKRNKEILKPKDKEYRTKHKERNKKYSKQYRIDNKEKMLFDSAKQRAKKKGLPFNIELSDIVIPECCPVLGIEILKDIESKLKPNSPSIDRFKPELGYVKGNITIMSMRANTLKNNASPKELEMIAKWMIDNGY